MKYNYDEIINVIPFETLLYEEFEFINILAEDYQKGSMLIEERDDKIIIWNTDLVLDEYYTVFGKFQDCFDIPVYVVYIDTQKEYDALTKLNAKKIEFDEQQDYPCKYGHFEL